MSRLRLPANWPDNWNLKQQGEEYSVNDDDKIVARVFKVGKEWSLESDLYGSVHRSSLNTLHDILHELALVNQIKTTSNNGKAKKEPEVKSEPEVVAKVHQRLQEHTSNDFKEVRRVFDELSRVREEARISHEFAVMTGRQWSEAISTMAKLSSQLEEAKSAIEYAQQKGFKWPPHALTFMQGNHIEH